MSTVFRRSQSARRNELGGLDLHPWAGEFQGTLGEGGVLRGSYFGSTDGNLYALE